jgi:anaerobic carbon-monoxide dehydrogenase, CODH/ACS complex subunit epsilon
MPKPHHLVNILTGVKGAQEVKDAKPLAQIIKRAARPLLVIGAQALEQSLGGRPFIDYLVEIARAGQIPICATAHTKKRLLELGITPESSYDLLEIINSVKDPAWKGVTGEGCHDLVIFGGVRTDLGNQGLSTLKHFAPHLKTMTLCKYYYPNAAFSLPNFRKDEEWKAFLDALIAALR